MKLLRDYRVKSWIQSYPSFKVRNNKGYALEALLRRQDLTVDELFRMPDDEVTQTITHTVRAVAEEGKKAFARNIMDSAKSLFLFHDLDIKLKSFAHLRGGKRTSEQIIPKPSDIYRMADTAGTFSTRNKALILCLFQSGVRTSCITRWNFGMVREFLYPDLRLPVQLKITSELDTKLPSYGLGYYVTFLGKEAAEALRDYIEQRKKEGWKPKESDIIFVTAGPSPRFRGEPLGISHIDEMMKRVARRSGLDPRGIWPYCLRKSFRKVMNNAPIDEDTKEALMGHTLPNSRTNYFDYHDLPEIARKYELGSFSSDSGSQFEALLARMDRIEAGLKVEIGDLRKQLQLLRMAKNANSRPTA
jgi:integrase